MSGAFFNQEGIIRATFHRFRACSDAHRDSYHAECPKCLLIESNVDRCMDITHVKDRGGTCLTCALLDGRVAGTTSKEETGLRRLITKYKGKP